MALRPAPDEAGERLGNNRRKTREHDSTKYKTLYGLITPLLSLSSHLFLFLSLCSLLEVSEKRQLSHA